MIGAATPHFALQIRDRIVAYLAATAILTVPTVAVAVPWLDELRRLFAG